MSKTTISEKRPFRPNPNSKHPPIEAGVRLPDQVVNAAALANSLAGGEPYSPKHKATVASGNGGFPHSDSAIDRALQRLGQGTLKSTDPEFEIIKSLATEGGRLIKAHRRGARQPRKMADNVTRRLEALIQAVRELSPFRLKTLTGTETLKVLRVAVINKLSLKDGDEVISEDTIKSDIKLVRPLLRLIQKGVIPAPGKPTTKTTPEKTQQEMEAGRRAVAKASTASGAPQAARPGGARQAG